MVATNSLQEGRSSPDVCFLSVTMIVNPKQGIQVIITETFPEIYLVKFRLLGRISVAYNTFSVHLVDPMDGYPLLLDREMGQLVKALNAAAIEQIPERRVSKISRSMIQTEGVEEIPRRKLQLAPGT